MLVFRLGAAGAGVRALQARLRDAGFCPGPVDGLFGARTAAAVRAFQGARGLAADGVAGPLTLAALGLAPGVEAGGRRVGLGYPALRAAVGRMFPAASGRSAASAGGDRRAGGGGADDAPMVVMALATIRRRRVVPASERAGVEVQRRPAGIRLIA